MDFICVINRMTNGSQLITKSLENSGELNNGLRSSLHQLEFILEMQFTSI